MLPNYRTQRENFTIARIKQRTVSSLNLSGVYKHVISFPDIYINKIKQILGLLLGQHKDCCVPSFTIICLCSFQTAVYSSYICCIYKAIKYSETELNDTERKTGLSGEDRGRKTAVLLHIPSLSYNTHFSKCA